MDENCTFWHWKYISLIDDWLIDNAPVQLKELAIPGKIQTGGGSWGHGISRGIEETACENSRGQLKKKKCLN